MEEDTKLIVAKVVTVIVDIIAVTTITSDYISMEGLVMRLVSAAFICCIAVVFVSGVGFSLSGIFLSFLYKETRRNKDFEKNMYELFPFSIKSAVVVWLIAAFIICMSYVE